jgi:hypothetical protein
MRPTPPVEVVAAPEKGYLTIRLDWFRLALAAIILFTLLTRFCGLAVKPYHHVREPYATYSWYLI